MDYQKRTGVTFGNVEAYAKRHQRIAPIIGTSIRISHQETGAGSVPGSTLLKLVEGASLNLNILRDMLPSLGSYAWLFSEIADAPGYQLITVSDGIEVALSIAGEHSSSSLIEIEGKLRGIAARVVVALSYGA